ncbi:hypothetical protein ACUNI3_19215 [Serratia sp. IR-2025]|uniref:hypothetical protein n=1 Tax=Serratia nevei TaxID=2703794 RepID=UPI002AA0D735|nr:hypothetical protein [Serratia nevei]
MKIEFDDELMRELCALASTREHGSIYTIVKKATREFVKKNTVNSTTVKEKDNDHSNTSSK